MKLIIGLGNQGKRYEKTRHNVGFTIADSLQTTVYSNCEWKFEKKFKAVVCRPEAVDILIAKPQTMMNDSGKAVVALATFYLPRRQAGKLHTTDIYVIHDDLDIVLGEYKIQKGKGPRDHNGLSSIDKALGTREYWHVRVGIENRRKKLPISNFQFPNKFKLFNFPNFKRKRISGEKFVLQNFTEKELKIIDEVADKVVGELSNDVLNR
ncbi:aminoacyl-tRNA hydrolase [Patescibacteria group bacterium]|nr:aminoacyl-tRNA hydrolase [Patescibacteria group bacterium]